MADQLNQFNFTFVSRSAPKNGPTSSDAWNDSFSELAVDLATITSEWNNKIKPIIDGLPGGSEDVTINAFQNGLDGTALWVDGSVESTSDDLTYYDSTNDRPYTVKESLDAIYAYVDQQIDQTTNTIVDLASGLTTDQKNRIGANIFDSTQVSSSTSLDGKSEYNRFNILQLAGDMYGGSYSLNNDGSTYLTNSVKDMVDALLELHNGDWDTDTDLNHVGAFTATQADINSSSPGDDSFAGSPADLEEDLDEIRTEIKDTKGTATWLTGLSSLYAGGADSLEDLLASTSGSGSKTATNPWGYQYDDIDGLVTRLTAIQTFTGMDSLTDSTPSYSSTNFINNDDDLETSLSNLDIYVGLHAGYTQDHATQLSGLLTFTGQNNISDDSPNYSSSVYIDDGDSLETAIGKLDARMVLVSGLHELQTFPNLTDTPNSYSGQAGKFPQVNEGETALEFSEYAFATKATSLSHYYLDFNDGNDNNSGTEYTAPKLTVDGINNALLDLPDNPVAIHIVGSGSNIGYQTLELRTGSQDAIVYIDGGAGRTDVGAGSLTVAAGSTSTSVKASGASWAVDGQFGRLVQFTSGTCDGQERTIQSNTADTLFLDYDLDGTPGAGDTFQIVRPTTSLRATGTNNSILHIKGDHIRLSQLYLDGTTSKVIVEGRDAQISSIISDATTTSGCIEVRGSYQVNFNNIVVDSGANYRPISVISAGIGQRNNSSSVVVKDSQDVSFTSSMVTDLDIYNSNLTNIQNSTRVWGPTNLHHVHQTDPDISLINQDSNYRIPYFINPSGVGITCRNHTNLTLGSPLYITECNSHALEVRDHSHVHFLTTVSGTNTSGEGAGAYVHTNSTITVQSGITAPTLTGSIGDTYLGGDTESSTWADIMSGSPVASITEMSVIKVAN